jgi:dTDP-4-amino-4,6-dideoxygalactose transaminase
MFTNDQRIHERALLFGHYERHDAIILSDLRDYVGLPCGGYKYRMHQLSSAFGLVQMKYYKQQFAEVDKAMNYFCDLLDEIPGLRSMRPVKGCGSTKGGWYAPHALYYPDDLGGLSVSRFSEAVNAEGVYCHPGCNKPLHLHPVFTKMDVYGHGKPTRIANLPLDVTIQQPLGSLPVTEAINERCCYLPRFIKFNREIIEQHAAAYKKVALNYSELLPGDTHKAVEGTYSNFRKK